MRVCGFIYGTPKKFLTNCESSSAEQSSVADDSSGGSSGSSSDSSGSDSSSSSGSSSGGGAAAAHHNTLRAYLQPHTEAEVRAMLAAFVRFALAHELYTGPTAPPSEQQEDPVSFADMV